MSDMKITTTIPYSEYRNMGQFLQDSINDCDIPMILSSTSVALSCLMERYGEWFAERNLDLPLHVFYLSWGGSKELICCEEWLLMETDIVAHWIFQDDEKDIATLFKLQFGGTQ